jgi:hypothetical protein
MIKGPARAYITGPHPTNYIMERRMDAVIMATVTAKKRRMTFFIRKIVPLPFPTCLLQWGVQ